MLENTFRKISKIGTFLQIKFHERTFENKLKYLFFNNHSDILLIVFSAFDSDDRRRYNYVKGLSACHCDKLYILDPWGYKGSYNMYENGQNYPEDTTNRLIDKYLTGGGINV